MAPQPKPVDGAPGDADSPWSFKAGEKPTYRPISDPREVATVVMARMNVVNARKNELAIAISGLADITQQLMRTYAEQLLTVEQLRRRVKVLEAGAAEPEQDPAPPAQ